MVAWLGKGGKRKGREKGSCQRAASWVWWLDMNQWPLSTGTLIITNPTLPRDLSVFKENIEEVKQSYNIKGEITNQYYDKILIK